MQYSRSELEKLVNPEVILHQYRKRKVKDIQDFSEEDRIFTNEINHADEARKKEIGKIIGKRFGDPEFVDRVGSAGTLHVTVQLDPPIKPWKSLRFKTGDVDKVKHNLQHILFLDAQSEEGEAGWNAGFCYGPDANRPLYVGMIEGYTATEQLRAEQQLETIDSIIEFISKYGLHYQNIHHDKGDPELVKSHLLLINERFKTYLRRSPHLNDERKEFWSGKVDKVVEHILKNVRNGKEPSTWVLTDFTPENLVNLLNPYAVNENQERVNKDYWAVMDQGYEEQILRNWLAKCELKDTIENRNKAFWGRIEYNLGQFAYQLQIDENIRAEIKKEYVSALKKLSAVGEIKGRELHNFNEDFTNDYILLGMLAQPIAKIANQPNEQQAETTNKIMDAILHNNPSFYLWSRYGRMKSSD